MDAKKAKPTTVDEYIAQCSPEVQLILHRIRAVIREAAPGAEERISYQMPGFFLSGVLVWFGAFKRHIGFYPTAACIEAFKEELSAYKSSKGSVQFPLDQPIPYELIRKIVRHRVEKTINPVKDPEDVKTPGNLRFGAVKGYSFVCSGRPQVPIPARRMKLIKLD